MAGGESSVRDRLRSLLSIPMILASRVSSRRDRLGILSNGTGRFELYDLPLVGGSGLTQISHGELERTPTAVIVWGRSDEQIVLSRDREGDELHDLYRFRLGSGEFEQITNDRTCQRYPLEFSPDGQWLVFASDKGTDGTARQMDLWRLPLVGGPAERLTHHAQPTYPWFSRGVFRPDGRKIAYGTSDGDDPNDIGVYVADSDGSQPELVFSTKKGSRDIPVGWSPDGTSIAMFSDAFDRLRTGILDVESREVQWMAPGNYDEIPTEFSPDGQRLLVTRTAGLRVGLVVYDRVTGGERITPFPVPYTAEAGFTSDEPWVLASRDALNRPREIVRWNPETDEVRVLWSPAVGNVATDNLAAGRIVQYPTFDGREIEALLVAPRTAEPPRGMPAIVFVHGGPTWQWYDEYNPVVQLVASRGFTVLLPNVRGSTGYGAAFRDLNRMDLGGGDLRDLEAAARYLGSLPGVDPTRLGVTGISYGGFLTYMALTKQPEIWAAGCAEAGVTDWVKGYDGQLPSLQHYLRSLMGDPVSNAALWADRSPVNFARQMRAPLLILHGIHDPRCPIIHAQVFREALVETGHHEGADFEYLEFSDEGHSSYDMEQQMRSVIPMVDFFERRLARPA